jgi:hypothetical protein
MEYKEWYNKFQAGFRPNYRTTDHIFAIKTIINKYLHKLNKPIFACFVDFSKAFGDRVIKYIRQVISIQVKQ